MRKRNQSGFIVSIELLFIIVFVVMGVVIGWTSIKDAMVNELVDTARAIDSLNQSYSFAGMTSHSGSVSGSDYTDQIDYCQDIADLDPTLATGRCVNFVAPTNEP